MNEDTEVQALGIDVPGWIEQDITVGDIEAIIQGGCASGAYMPAVTYHCALATMHEHGDEVWDYLDCVYGSGYHPKLGADTSSWAALACHYVSAAVEAWAVEAWDGIEYLEEEEEDVE